MLKKYKTNLLRTSLAVLSLSLLGSAVSGINNEDIYTNLNVTSAAVSRKNPSTGKPESLKMAGAQVSANVASFRGKQDDPKAVHHLAQIWIDSGFLDASGKGVGKWTGYQDGYLNRKIRDLGPQEGDFLFIPVFVGGGKPDPIHYTCEPDPIKVTSADLDMTVGEWLKKNVPTILVTGWGTCIVQK